MRFLALLFLALLLAPVAHAAELVMFEQKGCVWCQKFDREIAPAYDKTSEGKRAPLRRLDIAPKGEKWVTTWAASVQGPYPVGNPSAQPVLKFAFPVPEGGARDQTFRLIVQPEIWSQKARLRFSNVFGTRPISFDGVYTGLQLASATLVPGSNKQVMFGGKANVTI